MGLFKPVWQNTNEIKAVKAVEKMTDQAEIANAAKNATGILVRSAAVKKITSQAMLADIAKNAEYCDVCIKAIQRLTDQTLLTDIAKNADFYSRLEAAKKLTDQSVAQKVYSDLANNEENCECRFLAALELTDKAITQKVFAEIAINGSNWRIRETAINKLTDKSVLSEIINGSAEKNVSKRENKAGGSATATSAIDHRETARQRLAELEKNN